MKETAKIDIRTKKEKKICRERHILELACFSGS